MRSPGSAGLAPLLAAALAALLLAAALPARADEGAAPTREQVEEAVDQVREDPSLSGKRTQKVLRLKKQEPAKPPQPGEPAPSWLLGFVRWVAEASRLLVWGLGAVAVALLLVGLRHWIKWRGDAVATARALSLPSHVRDLDIRQESLPPDIGAAARGLWQQGQGRAALSLLYRGALSRLVHAHAVPIRSASTEGECVHLAMKVLPQERGAFFARLVQAWQLLVYGSRLPESDHVLALCDGFDAHLGPPQPPGLHAGAGPRPSAAGAA
jgi:hypothetical protein